MARRGTLEKAAADEAQDNAEPMKAATVRQLPRMKLSSYPSMQLAVFTICLPPLSQFTAP